VRTTFSSACRSFGRREVLRGVVVQTADTSGLVRLASGRRPLLPPLRRFGNRIVEGARVRVVAHGGPRGGPAIVTSVRVGSTSGPTLTLAPCMKLRIAPFQPSFGSTEQRHDPKGYEDGGTLWLEAGARLAATPKCASGKGRYSLAIEMSGAGPTHTVAEDLTDKDAAVPMAVGAPARCGRSRCASAVSSATARHRAPRRARAPPSCIRGP